MSDEAIDILSLMAAIGFNGLTGMMVVTMFRYALRNFGQPLQYVGCVDLNARLSWSTAAFMASIVLVSILRTIDRGWFPSLDSWWIVTAEFIRFLSCAAMFGAWWVWSRAIHGTRDGDDV